MNKYLRKSGTLEHRRLHVKCPGRAANRCVYYTILYIVPGHAEGLGISHGRAQPTTADQPSTAEHRRAQPSTADHSRAQPSTAEHSRAQPTTADYSRLRPSTRAQPSSRLQPTTADYGRAPKHSRAADYSRPQKKDKPAGGGASEASGLLPWNACSDAASFSAMGLSSFFRLHHEQPRFETSERRLWGHCFLNADATFRANLPFIETVDLYNIPALRTLPNIKPTKLLPSILVVQLCIQFQFSLHPTPCFAFNLVLFCHLPTINQRQTFSWAYATGLTFGNIYFTIFGSQIDAKTARPHSLNTHLSLLNYAELDFVPFVPSICLKLKERQVATLGSCPGSSVAKIAIPKQRQNAERIEANCDTAHASGEEQCLEQGCSALGSGLDCRVCVGSCRVFRLKRKRYFRILF